MSGNPPKRVSDPQNGGGKTNSQPTDTRPTRNESGRVKHDDRGNAIWEWAVATGKFGIDSVTQRLKKLEVPSLTLVDDPPPSLNLNPQAKVTGYNPYDSGQVAPQSKPRKTDLRKLGEWLKLQKQTSGKKPDKM